MSDQPPFSVATAFRSWVDLMGVVRSYPLLSAFAVIVCGAISFANADLAAFEEPSALATARALSFAIIEALLVTPVLLAAHRFVILGETTSTVARTLATRRFWRFFVLSAAVLVLLYTPTLLASWRHSADGIVAAALVAGIAASGASSLLLSLLFPAIAVDAPGTSIRNAVADLWGKVWSIFGAGLLAFLPVAVAALVMGKVQDAVVENSESLLPRLVAAPLDGAMAAATYVLLVLVASRYFLARADRLKRPG